MKYPCTSAGAPASGRGFQFTSAIGSIRATASLFLVFTVAGLVPPGTPVGAVRHVAAQDLAEGVWNALMMSPHGKIERPLFHVEHMGETIKAYMEWRTGRVEVHELNLRDGHLSFKWNPYFPMLCRFEIADKGQFKGSCMDENGGIGPAVLSPPGIEVDENDIELAHAYRVWGLTEEEYVRLRRGPLTPAEELRMLAEELLPTQTIDVEGRKVSVAAVGEGEMTVVFESGLGDDHTVWETVQSEVSKFARTISYDRAGLGRSDLSREPRSPSGLAQELRAMLRASGEMPPYVVVGHGSGAFTLRAFAEQFPDEVAGLVLVNPAHEGDDDALRRLDESSWQTFVSQKRSFLGVVSETSLREFEAYLATLDTWDDRNASYPHVPSIILAAGQAPDAPEWVGETVDGIGARIKLQRMLAEKLGAEFRLINGSTDLIQLEDPTVVVEAIQAVLRSVETMP